ncbi:MAG: CPBP family intramembrane metalloprotease [Gemmatimonadales bacterium]|nr:MAG: CPBP family intramembrane metalloprotease [Gemmatimonadales bacterium]
MIDEAPPAPGEPGLLRSADGRVRLGWRLTLGFLVVAGGLQLAGLAGRLSASLFEELPWLGRQAIQAVVMSGLVIPLIYLLRRRVDRRPLAGIGLGQFGRAARHFLLTLGIVAAFLAAPALLITVAGWGSFSVDLSPDTLAFMAAWLAIAFFVEAFPEEVAIRGYLYRNLSAAVSRWLASLVAVVLFALVPLVLVAIDGWLLGSEISLGGDDRLTLGYVLTILLFGALVQYLRVVTDSVWACIGFHLGFLKLGRWIGPHDEAFIRIEAQSPGAVDATLQISVLAGLLFILALPWLARRRVGWRERDPE